MFLGLEIQVRTPSSIDFGACLRAGHTHTLAHPHCHVGLKVCKTICEQPNSTENAQWAEIRKGENPQGYLKTLNN